MPHSHRENEATTRRRRIDPALEAAGWAVVDFDPARGRRSLDAVAVCEYPTGNGRADYALYVRGKVLGIVEAGRRDVAPREALRRAERYSKGASGGRMRFGRYRAPFVYSTNGAVVWCRDVRNARNRPEKCTSLTFHTPAALAERISRRAARRRLPGGKRRSTP